ncbi:MAG TPA: hypothetical protein VNB94_02120 [Mycobacteriales bacterium]|nr:hypothetical protein [Mycobacteriales bacterium]
MRRTTTAVALTTGFLAAQAFAGVGVSSAAPVPACPYPPNNPVLSAGLSRTTVTKGQDFTVSGTLTLNNCGVGSARVGLFGREAPGPYTYLNQTATNAAGSYSFTFHTDETLDLIVLMSATGNLPKVISNKVHVSVVG